MIPIMVSLPRGRCARRSPHARCLKAGNKSNEERAKTTLFARGQKAPRATFCNRTNGRQKNRNRARPGKYCVNLSEYGRQRSIPAATIDLMENG